MIKILNMLQKIVMLLSAGCAVVFYADGKIDYAIYNLLFAMFMLMASQE